MNEWTWELDENVIGAVRAWRGTDGRRPARLFWRWAGGTHEREWTLELGGHAAVWRRPGGAPPDPDWDLVRSAAAHLVALAPDALGDAG
jgi:hypothetical protein